MVRETLVTLLLTSCPQACAPPAPVAPITADRFADDLRVRLDGWYAVHAADAVDGNDLAGARAAVDPTLAVRATDPAEDPFGRDLGQVAVFLHPDVVWPGSDRVWVGAYDLTDGGLLEVEDFE